MNNMAEREEQIKADGDVITVRGAARSLAIAAGFGMADTNKIVAVASELARNMLRFAGHGRMRCRGIKKGDKPGMEMIFEDKGPGIPDVDLAMKEGYSTYGGPGMGLPGVKSAMSEMEINSRVGAGTTVTVRKWLR